MLTLFLPSTSIPHASPDCMAFIGLERQIADVVVGGGHSGGGDVMSTLFPSTLTSLSMSLLVTWVLLG